MDWLLLIYTVPSEPSRKRAAVWRELKKAGAIYLRDGVCVLPARAETTAIFRAIAVTITELGGQATLVENVRLDFERVAAIQTQARAGRANEYAEITREAERFLAHAQREREHRDFTFAELEEIEADLDKLKRWARQVEARDHFGAAEAQSVAQLLERCAAAVSLFLDAAYGNNEEVTGT